MDHACNFLKRSVRSADIQSVPDYKLAQSIGVPPATKREIISQKGENKGTKEKAKSSEPNVLLNMYVDLIVCTNETMCVP